MTEAEGFEARVRARVRLELQALSIAPGCDFSGKTDDEVRAHVVACLQGFEAITGKDRDYITGLFDGLISAHIADPVRRVLIARMDPRH